MSLKHTVWRLRLVHMLGLTIPSSVGERGHKPPIFLDCSNTVTLKVPCGWSCRRVFAVIMPDGPAPGKSQHRRDGIQSKLWIPTMHTDLAMICLNGIRYEVGICST